MVVGFAGAGRMGAPMIRRLARAGHRVLWHDPDATAGGELEAVRVADAGELSTADVSLSIVTDGRALAAVVDAIAPVAADGHLHISMSTVGPFAIREAAAAAPRLALVDAPVSGSVALAASGELTAIVGAAEEGFTRAAPILEDLTRTQLHVGGVGAGSALKLAVNTVVAATNQATGEALRLAETFGLERHAAYDVLLASVVSSPYLHYKRRAFTDATAPVEGSIGMLHKDVALALACAEQAGIDLPGVVFSEATLGRAVAHGRGADDVASLVRPAPERVR